MRFPRPSLLLVALGLSLAGCDRLTGEYDQKIYDAEAIGYACRVSLKTPEDCMKENETHSPTYVLDGWKAADKDIQKGTLDPTMGKGKQRVAPPAPVPAPAAEGGDKIGLPDLKSESGKKTEKSAKPAEKTGSTEKPKH